MTVRVTLLYFAALRDAAGVASETIDTAAPDLRVMYLEARARYGFEWPVDKLRVAVDGAFARWEDAPRHGSEVAFIPPVSGG